MKIPVSEAVGVRVIKRKPRRRTPMLVFGLPLVAAAMMIGSLVLSPGARPAAGTQPQPQEVAYSGQLSTQTSHHADTNTTPASSTSSSTRTSDAVNARSSSPTTTLGSTSPSRPQAAPASSSTSTSANSSQSSTASSSGSSGVTGDSTPLTASTPSLGVSLNNKPVISASSLNLTLN